MSIYLWGIIGLEAICLLWILLNSTFIKPLANPSDAASNPTVSLLIPMRNEERNIKELVQSLQSLTYPSFECILLDDQSTDQTKKFTVEAIKNDERFSLIVGKSLPEDWNGKVHACHQLSQNAQGEVLLFIDADVRLAPDTIERTVATFDKEQAGMISGFPHYADRSHLSQFLVTLQHFVVYAHLPISIANTTNHPSFTAACGGFIGFTRKAYDAIGGHEAVSSSLLEDVHLARETKKSGHTMKLMNISSYVSCYMYESLKEAIEGFTKNIFIGINKSVGLALLLITWYISLYMLPVGLLIFSITSGQALYAIPLILTVLQKGFVDYKNKTPLVYCLLMPFSALLFVFVLTRSMYTSIKGKAYTWKGRSYS
ncbi:glycosyltransferase [Pontibacillus sp. ALD_SL1]|uniref:glycosyltransferase n=1 Tax=Pontibacillus sp. ALD_SL1 TaxID=2777185 RepID=UPI001A96EAAE|nr:glycosyltransferase [Pontibacillus sp. ALD_SL1]QST01381.1 glycosyltransferase [Pontibacillus sp. ALD_SL1]